MSDPMDSIRIVLWGLGAMGTGIARLISSKESMTIVGAIDSSPRKSGKHLAEIVGQAGVETFDRSLPDIAVSPVPEAVIGRVEADLAVIATSSFVAEVKPQIALAIEAGLNVITIAEEMAFPHMAHPEDAREIDEMARRNEVSVLGTGINPGFILDTLVIALTGVCARVQRIRARRVNDLSPFGPTVLRTQGVGTTPEEFERGIREGTIFGHIGFPESIGLIARALGWKLDKIEQKRTPIISNTVRRTEYIEIGPGMVAGCNHTGYGYIEGREVIVLEHPQQIVPSAEGVDTGDYIWIEGDPGVNLQIKPEIPGGKGTIGIAVNMIPRVIEARPGLLTMADLPVPAAIL